ncbi:MAG: bacteriohemerythrin [Holophagaceae bacterium]|nr:bacteriohemerythrin [Holophagaceae bacterium]
MTIASWNSRFETGVEIIDAQHRALFAALNQLTEAFRSGTSGEHVKAGLAALLTYAAEHFQTEEAFMRERGYPDLAVHAAEHVRLVERAHDLETQFREGRPVAMELTIFLADLLAQHIDEFDTAMVRFLKNEPPIVTVKRL